MAAPKKKSVVVPFERERATKNKQRFKEVGDKNRVGIIYVSHATDKELDKPEELEMELRVK